MGWCHPDISLDNLMNLVKGFVDILILASGYQSSGLHALWDAENIRKAVQWGVFFEKVFKQLCNFENYDELVKELDASLLELTSNPLFPQGIVHLSTANLARARDFVLEHLLQTISLRDEHLTALLIAAVHMDLENIHQSEYDCLSVYIEKLMHQMSSLNLTQGYTGFIKDSSPIFNFLSEDHAVYHSVSNSDGLKDTVINPRTLCAISDMKIKEHTSDDHSSFIIQELLKRQTAMSCISSVETSLDILSGMVTRIEKVASGNCLFGGQSVDGNSPENEEKLKGFAVWSNWRSRNLSYLLDKRTVRLVSGASLIFSTPKAKWLHVFAPLKISMEAQMDGLLEIIELSLLGILSSRWSRVIEHLMSATCDHFPIFKQFYELCNLLQVKSQFPHLKEEPMNSKENDILEYLMVLVSSQLHQLWSLPPVLAAAAIPSRSPLFKLYLNEIERQMKGDYSTIRRCTCHQDQKEHSNCEIAERVCCLYIFHVQGSYWADNSTD